MENINTAIHQQLKEYAQRLFTATVNAYTTDGKCSLKPGKYAAKELANFQITFEVNTGHALTLEEMEEEVTVSAGEFNATFLYADIFSILARWEAMMKPGKDKAIFEIGNVEIISAKVLTSERTELGAFKEKRIKLRKLHGNWYAPEKLKKNDYNANIYYKHNAVIYSGGKLPLTMLEDKNRERLIARLNEVEGNITNSLLRLAENDEYFAEVCKRMNLTQQPTTPEITSVEIVRNFDGTYYANLTDANGDRRTLSAEYITYNKLKSLCRVEYGVELPSRANLKFEKAWAQRVCVLCPTKLRNAPNFHGKRRGGNVSTVEEEREIKHISEIMETCRLLDDNGEMTDEYKYYNWLAYVNCVNYQTITEKALTEAWTNIFLAAYRRGKGHILAMNTRGELVDTVFVSVPQLVRNSDKLVQPPKQALQPRKIFPAINYATPTLKARETARKRQNSVLRKFRTTHTISLRSMKWYYAVRRPRGAPVHNHPPEIIHLNSPP